MKKISNILRFGSLFSLVALITLCACHKNKDEHKPPILEFKTGATYVSSDRTLPRDTTIIVGINATFVEDEFKTFNVSNAFDGASASTSVSTEKITGAEQKGLSRDVTIHIRNQAGTERWTFTMIDIDGNTSKLTLNFTVI